MTQREIVAIIFTAPILIISIPLFIYGLMEIIKAAWQKNWVALFGIGVIFWVIAFMLAMMLVQDGR